MIRRSDYTWADAGGTPEPGVWITVKTATGALATLYNDDGSSLSNPFQSGTLGAFVYNVAAEGGYTEEYRLSPSDSPRKVLGIDLSLSEQDLTLFGAAGNDSTDDATLYAAVFAKALANKITGYGYGYGSGGGEIVIRKARPAYRISASQDVTTTVILRGVGTGGAGGFSTITHADADIFAIRVQAYNTFGDTDAYGVGGNPPVPSPTVGGQGSIIERQALVGSYNGTTHPNNLSGGAGGLLGRGHFFASHLNIWQFQGPAIRVRAGWSDPEAGAANFFKIDNCLLQYCLDGVDISGVDTNQGEICHTYIISCRRWGVLDASTGVQCYNVLAQGCGFEVGVTDGTAAHPTPVVKKAGYFFVIKDGHETAGSTNSPPSTPDDNADWFYWKPDNGDGWAAWASGISLRAGGDFRLKNGGVLFLSYSEGNVPGQLGSDAAVIGGLYEHYPYGGARLTWSSNQIAVNSLRIERGGLNIYDDVGGSVSIGRSSVGAACAVLSPTAICSYLAINAPDGSQKIQVANSVVNVYGAEFLAASVDPISDNALSLGRSGHRWTELWAASATIQTSDRAQKSQVRKLSGKTFDALLDAVGAVPLVAFKFKDAVKAKGKKARDHYGIIAQDLHGELVKRGLDPFAGGVLGFDQVMEEIEEQIEVEREAMRTVFVDEEQIEVVDGKAVRRTVQVEKQTAAFVEVPVVDENGEPVMIPARAPKTLGDGDPGSPARPRMHPVRRMETVKETRIARQPKLKNGEPEMIWNVRYSELAVLQFAWMQRELKRKAP